MKHVAPQCLCPGKRCERCKELLCHLTYGRKRTGVYGLREKCRPCHRAALLEKREQPTRHASEERIAALRAMPYQEYLRTQEWLARRAVKLKISEYRCQLCNSSEYLNVHHRTYERLGCEKMGDLLVLCRECHRLFHERRRLVKAGGQVSA